MLRKYLLALALLAVCVNAEASSFMDELLRLEGVVSVDVVTQTPNASGDVPFKEKYIARFEQPIDWSNSDGGKFLQRVEIGYQGMDNVNVAYVGGYNLRDKDFPELFDLPVGMWQYDKNFDSFDEVLNMPKSTSSDKESYLREMLRLLRENDSASDMGNDEDKSQTPRVKKDYAYWVQVHKENGAYGIMFKYFREAVEKEGLTLKFKEEDEPGYYARANIKPNLLATLSYDSTLSDNIRKWSHTTESKVIMIYGISDPWYTVRIEDVTDNPNVRVFAADYGHGAEISMLKSEDKATVTAILDIQLQTPGNAMGAGSSGGSCNFSGTGALMLVGLLVCVRRIRIRAA